MHLEEGAFNEIYCETRKFYKGGDEWSADLGSETVMSDM